MHILKIRLTKNQMAQVEVKFEIELDSFSDKHDYFNVVIENLDEKWQQAAKLVLGETPEKRLEGLKLLKVKS